MECPFTGRDVERANRTQVTPRIYANATFEGVRALRVFSEIHLRGVLQGLLATTERERAVLRLYYRLAAFTRVERYRVAKRLVDFYASHPLPPDFNIAEQRRVCSDAAEEAAVEALIVQYWGRDRNGDLNWPIHWSCFRDARGRARHVAESWEERYVRYYYVLSWHVHSGAVGVAGLAQDVFDIFVADAHRLIRDSVIDSYGILGHELHLAGAIERWPETVEFLRNVSGFTLVDLRLQALGEPPRFLYLEEHEQGVV